ncbi:MULTISPECIES: universal stress protein [unclassified Halorubrum]|uniref:universal stress protein n=1 Tax=unclassified Halorubrum TaxID=2642239 RepID=UPI000B9991BD|nr:MULTISPECIES: universal stress protein [unclassified Halorubrum]OYR43469.1 universal stress protein UspA [Halorubrum sp. Eb13]OYR47968.1 universal stress protein UspA [Halorubrum sp. Ea8]
MFDRILFPTDGGDGADATFDHVLDLAADHDATVHVLNVADTTHDSVTRVGRDVVDVLEREGEDVVDAAAERAADRGVETVTAVLQGGVGETIVAYAAEHEVDLVAMPTRGREGLDQLLLGSTTERVVRRSPVPVLSLRPDGGAPRYPYRNVLLPTDGSDRAVEALDRAVALAARSGATLHVLSVVDVGTIGAEAYSGTDALVSASEETVADAVAVAEAAGVETVERVEVGSSAARGIRSYIADHDVDLVVMGTRGLTGVERYLLGSVAERTVRTSPVPVLTVPESDSE